MPASTEATPAPGLRTARIRDRHPNDALLSGAGAGGAMTLPGWSVRGELAENTKRAEYDRRVAPVEVV